MKCSTVQVQKSLTDSVVSYAAVSVSYTRPSKAQAAEPRVKVRFIDYEATFSFVRDRM